MGVLGDCSEIRSDQPESPLPPLRRDVIYNRVNAFSMRIAYMMWNIAVTILLYLFPNALLNGYAMKGYYLRIIIFHSFQFLSICFYYSTSLCDPGFIPLNENENALFEEEESLIPDNIPDGVPEWNRNIVINIDKPPVSFCWHCRFVRPLRSKHCYDCGRCVGRFDHHCPIMGNCIGGKNHRHYVLFLFFESVVVLWALQLSVDDICKHHIPQYLHLQELQWNAAVTLKVVFLGILWSAMTVVVGLCGLHCYLSSTNQTTYDMLKPLVWERWVKEERERKQEYLQYHPVPIHVDDEADEYQTEGTDGGPGHRVRVTKDERTFHRSRYSQHISFSEGICRNLYHFWTAQLHSEWMTPLSCVLRDESGDQ